MPRWRRRAHQEMSEPVNAFPSRVRWVGRRELLTSRPVRRYSIHLIASRGRFFKAGEPIPDDVSVPPFAEKQHRIRDEQQQSDEKRSRESTTPPLEHTFPPLRVLSVRYRLREVSLRTRKGTTARRARRRSASARWIRNCASPRRKGS